MVCWMQAVEECWLTKNRMIKVSDAYSLEDLCEMSDEDMKALLGFYGPDKVPRMKCLRAMGGKTDAPSELGCLRPLDNEIDAFDGSFGFFVGWG